MDSSEINKTAISATLHCLTGCAIGEILGLIIGTALGFSTLSTLFTAVMLAFLFGYALSLLPLVQSGLTLSTAMTTVIAADTISIATMELTDNLVMLAVPGAMEAGLVNPLFWLTMPLALVVAFFVALPVNRYMLKRGKGHALIHEHHQMRESHSRSGDKK